MPCLPLINYNKPVILQFKMAEEPAIQKSLQQTPINALPSRPTQSTELKLSGAVVKSTEGDGTGPKIEKRVSFEAKTESV